eukprot:4076069-Amphidinium_carterae.1
MCAGTTATSRTARMYRWSFALSTGATCQTAAHRSRARTTSRRFLQTTTGPEHPGSLISLTREHFCQGDRQLGLNHDARDTGTLLYHLRVRAWPLGPWEAQSTACLAHQPYSLKHFSRLRLPWSWRSLLSTHPPRLQLRCIANDSISRGASPQTPQSGRG